MKLINNYSIRTKLTFIVMMTTCVSLLLALFAIGVIDTLSFRAQMLNDASSVANMIVNNSKAALTFDDGEAAREILESLKGDTHVGSATLLREDGRPMAEYRRPDWSASEMSPVDANHVSFNWDRIEIAQPVRLDGKRIGAVVMQ